MRGSELLGLPVRDANGARWGVVVDVLIDVAEGERTVERWDLLGVVVAPPSRVDGWSHFTGLPYARQRGPWPLSVLGARAGRRARFVAADQVSDWSPQGLMADPSAAATLARVQL